MPEVRLRKQIVTIEEIFHEGGPPVAVPHRRGAVLAVIANPFSGR
ncbi:MAG: amino acid synthesis family protein, partial [Caulobacteraceae bacterium]|nr:amino acid synthesis family protein [Caulobacter sp.]